MPRGLVKELVSGLRSTGSHREFKEDQNLNNNIFKDFSAVVRWVH